MPISDEGFANQIVRDLSLDSRDALYLLEQLQATREREREEIYKVVCVYCKLGIPREYDNSLVTFHHMVTAKFMWDKGFDGYKIHFNKKPDDLGLEPCKAGAILVHRTIRKNEWGE